MLEFLENRTIITVSAWLGVALTIILIYLYFRKKGRDERERGIFATASLIALCAFCILVNISG